MELDNGVMTGSRALRAGVGAQLFFEVRLEFRMIMTLTAPMRGSGSFAAQLSARRT